VLFKHLEADGLTVLPDGLTLHALRRSFGSLLIAIGRDQAYVMAQMGHTSPTMTLGLYAQVMSVANEDREKLRALVGDGPTPSRAYAETASPASSAASPAPVG